MPLDIGQIDRRKIMQVILVKLIRKFYDDKGNIYEIYKKRNNQVYLTITNKENYKKQIATTKYEIIKYLKEQYKNTKFTDEPILNRKEYQY